MNLCHNPHMQYTPELSHKLHEPMTQADKGTGDEGLTSHQVRWRWVGIGLLLLLVLAENNAMRFFPPAFDFIHYHIQFALFVGGVGAILYGMSGGWRGHSQAGAIGAGEWLVIAAIFVVALIPRVVALDTLVRTLVDETPWVDGIRALWGRQDYELLRPMSNVFPFTSLFPYVEAGFVEIFGRNFYGLRLASSVTGALTVVALYALARHLFDRQTAVIAALLLACFPPHIHFSRLALLNLVDALPGTLALAWIARGLRYNRRLDWALAGTALGMTHYFFEAGRLLFLVLVIAWGVWLFLTQRALFRARTGGFVVLLNTTLLIALPVYYVFSMSGATLAGRLDQSRLDPMVIQNTLSGVQSPDWLVNHVLATLLIYINRPETAAYYGGDLGLVLPGLVPLLLLGAGFVLVRPRRSAFVLLIWVLGVSAGNALLTISTVAARYVIAMPALALLMAVGLRETVRLLSARAGNRTVARALRWAMVLAIPILGALQIAYYFGPHIERFNVQNRQLKAYGDGVDVALRAAELPQDTIVFIIGEPESDTFVPGHFLEFLRPDMRLGALTPGEVTHRLLADLSPERPYAFFIEAGDAHTLNLLRYYFILLPPQISPNHAEIPMDRQYVLYFAPLGGARITQESKPPER